MTSPMPAPTRTRPMLAGAAAALLAGCTVGPSFKSPAPPDVSTYSMQGDATANEAAMGDRLAGDWWALFRSPQIDQTIRTAVAGNRTLEAARQSLAEARDAIAAQAPAATLNASGGVQEQRVNLSAFGFSGLPFGGGGRSATSRNPPLIARCAPVTDGWPSQARARLSRSPSMGWMLV